jgi:hypothetical protein
LNREVTLFLLEKAEPALQRRAATDSSLEESEPPLLLALPAALAALLALAAGLALLAGLLLGLAVVAAAVSAVTAGHSVIHGRANLIAGVQGPGGVQNVTAPGVSAPPGGTNNDNHPNSSS